jgi:hypothetical protein
LWFDYIESIGQVNRFDIIFSRNLEMAKKKAATRGGKREGAGRKPGPEGKTTLVAVTVPNPLVEQLDELREKRGWNRSQAVTEAIRALVQKS